MSERRLGRSGDGAARPQRQRPEPPRRPPEPSSARRLLRRLVQVVAEPVPPQRRMDEIVALIAADLVADVCSIYARRAGDVLELFATQGLAREAVHRTRLQVGEGLVGTIAATGDIISTDDASRHPAFVYRPETAEESYRGFLGVPIARGGAVVGVLVVQNTAAKPYDEDEIEALQVIASVLAEMFSSGGIVDRARFTDVDSLGQEPRRVGGLRLVEGLGIGKAWLHAPKIEVANLLSDDPALEISRLELAVTGMRDALDRMMDRSDLAAGDQREVLEAYRMFAHDSGWFRRIREAIGTGLSAEAAVRRVQEMTELRLGHASDPYLRERLLDLDDLADRLLMHLAGRDRAREAHALPPNSIIVARNLSAADLIEYDRTRIRGIVLEEGSSTAHLTVVARAFDVPVLGRVERALRLIHNGDLVALDGETGQAFLRPTEDVVEAFRQSIAVRAASRRMFEAHKNEPSVTADGLHVALELNAAFVLDLAELDRVAAEGVGLYRTELAYMTRSTFPTITEQASHYGRILDLAGARPVTFRTLDIGSDKQVPYWHIPEEENPAMGWRALRMMLDRPWILRAQLRALLTAAAGRRLRLMFPMVAEVAEFDRARHLLDLELARGRARGQQAPATLEVGAMMEVPALFWQLPALLPRIDFVSVGSNDLLQFLFACDRGSPLLSERYDVLSPPALSFVRALAQQCTSAGVGLSVCGEMASRPIEAMALIGLGVRRLSLSPAQIGPVKAMLRSLDAGALASYLGGLLSLPDHSLRQRLGAWARDHSVDLPSTFARN